MTQTPFIIHQKANALQMVFSFFFTAMWVGITSFMLFTVHTPDTPQFVYLILGGFLVLGFLPVLFLVRKHGDTIITIHNGKVDYLFKRKFLSPLQWTEDLRNYKGIVTRTVQRRVGSGKHRRTVTFFEVHLDHPDQKKFIMLGSFSDELSQRNRAEECSKQIGLHLLVQDAGGGFRKVETADLDKKFFERTDEKIIHEALPDFPAGKRYSVEVTADGFTLVRKYPNAIFWAVGLGAAGIVLSAFVHVGAGIVPIIIAVLAFGTGFKGGGTYVVVSAAGIESYSLMFNKKTQQVSVPLESVEEIVDAHDMSKGNVKSFNICVQVRSDRGIINIAHGAKPEVRDWIKRAISKYVYARQSLNQPK